MKYPFCLVDVFTSRPFGGNPLAVVLDARGLSSEGMQRIAGEFNFSETTFVFPPSASSSTARVRIFTPGGEIDFAGHPTVGTACALAYTQPGQPKEMRLEENIGVVAVTLQEKDTLLWGTLTNTQPLSLSTDTPDRATLSSVLSIPQDAVINGFFAGVGLDFCFAHLRSPQIVDQAKLNRAMWAEYLADAWSPHIFLFAGDLAADSTLYARMFAPALGIEEDPATGSAVAALAAVAALETDPVQGDFHYSVRQGVLMGRTSDMTADVSVRNRRLRSVSVGGAAVLVARGSLHVAPQWL